jgi:hypothetical protein
MRRVRVKRISGLAGSHGTWSSPKGGASESTEVPPCRAAQEAAGRLPDCGLLEDGFARVRCAERLLASKPKVIRTLTASLDLLARRRWQGRLALLEARAERPN